MNPEELKKLIKQRISFLLSEQELPPPVGHPLLIQLKPILTQVAEDATISDEIKAAASTILDLIPADVAIPEA